MLRKVLLTIFAIASLFSFSRATLAATYTWDGGGVDNNWSTCDNWSTNVCPTSADSVIFSASSTKDATISADITITSLSINSGYSGTIAPSTSAILITLNGAFSQAAGTFTASGATTTIYSSFTYTAGTFNHNSGTVLFYTVPNSTVTHTPNAAVFYNVVMDSNTTGSNQLGHTLLASNMTVAGNLSMRSTNTTAGSGLVVRSDNTSATRTISVAGDFLFPTTAQTTNVFHGNPGTNTFPLNIVLMGNLALTDSNSQIYGDITFASSSTQTISKHASATLYSQSDWYDTGSGNLSTAQDFSTMTIHTDSSDDFNFVANTNTFSPTSLDISSGTTFTPAGTNYSFGTVALSTGTFNASASTTIGTFTQTGGTMNLSSATTTFTGSFTYTSGTFNHNSGTALVYGIPNATVTYTTNAAVFNNVAIDSYSSGVNSTANFVLASNLTVAGNLSLRSTNTIAGSSIQVKSDNTSATRTISVAGDFLFPTTSQTSGAFFGYPSANTFPVNVTLMGNLDISDANVAIYGDITFASSSTQSISKNASATIYPFSDWYDTGSGNLSLSADFSMSGVLHTDSSDDFNFTSNNFIFSIGSLDVAAGTTFTPAGTNYSFSTVALTTTGTFNASASTTIGTFSQSAGTFNLSSATTTFTGNLTYTSGTFNHNSGTVLLYGAPNGTITYTPNAAVFNNVTMDVFAGSNIASTQALASNMTIAGNLVLKDTNTGSGATLNLKSDNSTATRTISVAGDFLFPTTAQNTGVVFGNTGANTFPVNVVLMGNLSLTDTNANLYGDITFASSSTQTISKNASANIFSFSDWYDTGSGNLSTAQDFSTMTIHTDSSDDFNFVANTNTFSPTSLDISSGTTFTPAGTNYSFGTVALSTGTFNASASTTIGTFTQTGGTYNGVSVGTTTFTGAFTYTSGTFNSSTGGIAFTSPVNTSLTHTFGSVVFNHVLFDYISGGSLTSTISFASNMTVGGDLYLRNTNTSTGDFLFVSNSSTATRTISVAGNLVFPSTAQTRSTSLGSGATFPLQVNLSGNLTMLDTQVNINNDIYFVGTTTQNITQSAGNISSTSDWVVNKTSGETVFTTAVTNSGTIAVATGTLRTASFGLTATAGLSVAAGGNLQIQGGETITTPTFATGATMTYDGTSSAYTLKNYSYKNLKLQGGVSTVFSQPATLTIAGDLNIATGTLDASVSNYSLNVSGNWLNTGTFTPRTGTVTLNGTNQAITGTTTFYNLTKSVGSAATLTFGAGQTQTISNTWTANGASGNLLSLRSTTPTTQWNVNPQTTRTLSFIDVQDSNNTNVTPVGISANMVNSGNNTNWSFDSTAPVISVVASSTGTSTATISWTTDEVASSSISYGLTTSYGTVASSSATTTHSVSLTGLTENTLYHFQVLAIDTVLNTSTSTDYTFRTTDGTAPVISVVASSTAPTTATVTWTTDELSTSVVNYGTTISYGSASSSSALVTNHSIVLTGLTDLTTYHFKVTSVDASSNSASSTGYTLRTTDGTAPIISNIASTTATSTASVTWDTNEAASSSVQYGLTTSYGSTASSSGTANHSANISGLSQNTLYHYRILAIDASGNTSTSSDRTFTTTDGTAPTISSVASTTAPTTATISWTTNEAATSVVDYGTTLSYGSASSSSALVTNHSIVLTGLTSETLYYFTITSIDPSSNSTTSAGYTFRTSDNTPAVISSVASTTATSTATVSWNTSEAASSSVRYGLTTSYGAVASSSATSSHSASITGLTDRTLYHYQILAIDVSGNISTSTDYTFTTTDGTAPVISSIASSTSYATATVSWNTDEIASSSIAYGLTTSYGTVATSSGSTIHSVNLSSLTADTTYHYRVLAVDAFGNVSTSTDRTFRTAVTPDSTAPILTFVASSTASSSALITWSTDEAASSTVHYGLTTSYGSSVVSSGTSSHSFSISSLAQNTLYHYEVVATDASGNTSTSSDRTFRTTDETAPTISVVASSTGATTATISWTTNEVSTSVVDYGTTLSYGSASSSVILTTNHTISLTGLIESTTYHFKVTSVDASSNSASSTGYTLRTTDGTAPIISNIASTTATSTASVTWDTNEAASSSIQYGLTTSYGSTVSSSATSSHSVNISSLSESVTYHYRVIAIDVSGNTSTSSDNTFTTTLTPDTTAPNVSIISPTSAEVVTGSAVSITALATDNINISNVIIYIDNVSYPLELSTPPYTYVWNSTLVANGAHTVYAVAQDYSLNTATSTTISFTVDNVVSVTSQPEPVRTTTVTAMSAETVLGCHDTRAKNYNPFSEHTQSLCVYDAVVQPIIKPTTKPTATNSVYSFNRDLQLGSRGVDVKELQKYLNKNGFLIAKVGVGSPGRETDQFGAGTKAALIKFQKAKGVPATGLFGPKTRAKMN